MFISTLYQSTRQFPTVLLRHVMLVLLAAALAACDRAPTFHATDITGASFGKLAVLDGLTDHAGRRLATADFAGKAVVVFFGYTQCPDICPTALATMQETMRMLGAEADRVQVLFVTVDPERDTQAVLQSYVPWFDARFLGLRGDAAATLAAAQEFRVFYARVKGSGALDYSIDHSATSYAFDPQGRIRLLVKHGEMPPNVAADLRQLLAGK
jgi:protein SCO1/2